MIWVAIQSVLLAALLVAFFASAGTSPVLGAMGRIVGTLGAVFGVGLAARAFRDLGHSFRVSPEPKPGATLVRTGIYGFLRHPMYTSVVLVALGLLWLRPSSRVFLMAVLVVGFYLLKARYEEKRLRARYPDYEEHARQTYGVLPLPRPRG